MNIGWQNKKVWLGDSFAWSKMKRVMKKNFLDDENERSKICLHINVKPDWTFANHGDDQINGNLNIRQIKIQDSDETSKEVIFMVKLFDVK